MGLSRRMQFGAVVAACALAAAGAAYATTKLRHSHSSFTGLTPGYVGTRARGWDGRPFGPRPGDDGTSRRGPFFPGAPRI